MDIPGLVFGLVATLIAVGGVIVSITTRINHIEHIKTDIRRIEESLSAAAKQVEELRIGIGRIEEQIKGIVKVCEERHEK